MAIIMMIKYVLNNHVKHFITTAMTAPFQLLCRKKEKQEKNI